jgi:hypothetical protein
VLQIAHAKKATVTPVEAVEKPFVVDVIDGKVDLADLIVVEGPLGFRLSNGLSLTNHVQI